MEPLEPYLPFTSGKVQPSQRDAVLPLPPASLAETQRPGIEGSQSLMLPDRDGSLQDTMSLQGETAGAGDGFGAIRLCVIVIILLRILEVTASENESEHNGM